jgi:hypothetical protein
VVLKEANVLLDKLASRDERAPTIEPHRAKVSVAGTLLPCWYSRDRVRC